MSTAADELTGRLARAGQGHLVEALERLDREGRGRLSAQIAELDLELIERLTAGIAGGGAEAPAQIPADVGPPETVPLPRTDAERATEARAREAGEEHLRAGAVAVVLLAGGQGTRLGFDGPKGDYPFAPLSGTTLFAHHAAKVAAIRRRYGCALPWLVLTSPANDATTRESFRRAGHFGLPSDSVRFFVQGTMPAVDAATGCILLEAPDRLALSPDGHGGVLAALRRTGLLDELAATGVTTLHSFQVDNPLLRLARPELIGHHLLARAEMSNVVVRKLAPQEKMGVVTRADGRTLVIEYSDLPDDLAARRDASGELLLWAGSIAVHCLEREFVERITADRLALPYHRALKQVPHVRLDGTAVAPGGPNAIKLETFLFDALPHARRTVSVESAREDDFSPIKNATGTDSPETARRDLNRLYARWLAEAGVDVPDGADGEPVDLEIDPRLALDAQELSRRLPPGFRVEGPTIIGPEPLG